MEKIKNKKIKIIITIILCIIISIPMYYIGYAIREKIYELTNNNKEKEETNTNKTNNQEDTNIIDNNTNNEINNNITQYK